MWNFEWWQFQICALRSQYIQHILNCFSVLGFSSWLKIIYQKDDAKEKIKMIFRVQRKNADIYHQFYFLVKKKSLFVFQVKCVQYAFFRFLFFCSFVRQWIVRVIKPRNMVTIDEMWIRNYRNWNSWKRINSARQPVVSVICKRVLLYICLYIFTHTYTFHIHNLVARCDYAVLLAVLWFWVCIFAVAFWSLHVYLFQMNTIPYIHVIRSFKLALHVPGSAT